jgi:DNA-binding transcriptional MerR regulator
MAETFSIGELGRRTGTKVNTVRFYEDIGLLPQPARTSGGRRIYGEGEAQRLAFIRQARALGFSTEEVRSLLSLTDQPDRDCGEAAAIARRHLASIEHRIAQLQAMHQALTSVTSSCEGGPIANCRIIEAIAGARR